MPAPESVSHLQTYYLCCLPECHAWQVQYNVLISSYKCLCNAQEAAIGADAWQMHLQCLLARASLQLPPPPLTSQKNQCQLHHVPTHANLAVLDTLDDALAEHLPDWKKWLQAPDFSQAEPLGRLLAKMQWQVLGMVKALYASLAGNSSANSPTRRRLDVKVRLINMCKQATIVHFTLCTQLDGHGPGILFVWFAFEAAFPMYRS